jgi:DNA-binding transcriptional regulator YdaS (Cro superfamily)
MSNLSALLKNRGLRLIDLARKLGVNKATVSRWAEKKVPTERLADVERVTGIAPCDLRPDLAPILGTRPLVEETLQ